MPIRAVKMEDVSQMLEIYRPFVENTPVSFEYVTPTVEEFSLRVEEHTRRFPWLVWEESGQVLGYAYAGQVWERAAYRWGAECSVYLAPQARGRGLGRALYEALEKILGELGYLVLYAVITLENRDSIAFHRAMGFVPRAEFPRCGYKFGRWYGVCWMEKRLNGRPEEAPRPWQERKVRQ